MATTIHVDALRFMFQPSIAALKYDDCQHYRTVWQLRAGQTAVDIVAMKMAAVPDIVWLIEAKDFRMPKTLDAKGKRIVLHLEPFTGARTKLFPVNFSGGVLQKLKQTVKEIDLNPLVPNISNTSRAGVDAV